MVVVAVVLYYCLNLHYARLIILSIFSRAYWAHIYIPFFFKGDLFLFFLNLFIFGCVGSSLLQAGSSLVAESGGYSLLQCLDFSLRWLLLLQSTGSRHALFSRCGLRAQELWLEGSRAQAQ